MLDNKHFKNLIYTLSRVLDVYVILIFLSLFFAGLYMTMDTFYVYYHAINGDLNYNLESKTRYERQEEIDLEHKVAWLYVTGTRINYPIMQGESNSTYLNMDPYGNYSISGSIFLDSRNSSDFTDQYSLVYGHHMSYGVMFGALDEFKKESYFNAHTKGILSVDDSDLDLNIFAVIETSADEPVMFDPTDQDRDDILVFLKRKSLFYREPGEGTLLGLSTCSESEGSARLIVFAEIVRNNTETKEAEVAANE